MDTADQSQHIGYDPRWTAALATRHRRMPMYVPGVGFELRRAPQPVVIAPATVVHQHAAPQLHLSLTRHAPQHVQHTALYSVFKRVTVQPANALQLLTVSPTQPDATTATVVPAPTTTLLAPPAIPATQRPQPRIPPVELVVRRDASAATVRSASAAAAPPSDHASSEASRTRQQPASAPEFDIGRLADHVLSQIDRRTTARRERLGRG